MDSGLGQRLWQRIRNLIGTGKAARVDDTGPQQLWQIHINAGGDASNEEVQDGVPRLGEYGLASCPPLGAEGVVIYLAGNRSSGVVIATGHRASRPVNLQPGEAMLYNGVTGAYVRMMADGTIQSSGTWHHLGSFSASSDITDQTAGGNTKTVKNLRDAYDAHKHTGVTTGAGSTGLTDHNV